MKKFLFLLSFIMAPAHAELTKCVYLNPEMNCRAGGALASYEGTANWDATCTDSVEATQITGAWRCGHKTGKSQGATTDQLDIDTDTRALYNTDCWCKMLTPAVSMWVYHSTVSSQGTCYYTCGRLCLEALQQSGATAFKTAMFNNLGA